jgi:GAF domain-containing protein
VRQFLHSGVDVSRENLTVLLKELSGAPDVMRVAEVVRTVARTLVGADGVTFVVRNGDRCCYVEENAIGPLWKGQQFPMTECVSGWVMLNATSVIIPDIYADRRVPADAYRSTFVKSLAMVPVGRPVPFAAIGAYWARHHEATNEEVEILQALADSAALALQD